MRSLRNWITIPGLALMALLLAACEAEGPAEQMGEKVDHAAEEAREGIEHAGEAASSAMKETGEKVESATE